MNTTEWKFLLTGITEGTAVQTVKSGSEVQFILAYKGHHFDQDWNIKDTSEWLSTDKRWKDMRIPSLFNEAARELFGLHIVGFPPRKVIETKRTWTEWEVKGTKENEQRSVASRKLRVREENTRYFFAVNFEYAFTMNKVETNVGIKVDLDFTLYVKGVNPMTALVKNNDWFMALDGLARARVKNFFGNKSFFDLLSEEGAGGASLGDEGMLKDILIQLGLKKEESEGPKKKKIKRFSAFMKEMKYQGKSLPESLGIEIVDAKMESLDLSEDETLIKEMQEMLRKNVGEIEESKAYAEALENKSEADKKAAILKSEGEAEGITKIGLAKATSMDQETEALTKRIIVEEQYAKMEGGSDIVRSRIQAEGMVKTAEAIAKMPGLTSVVFPQNSPVNPVVTVDK